MRTEVTPRTGAVGAGPGAGTPVGEGTGVHAGRRADMTAYARYKSEVLGSLSETVLEIGAGYGAQPSADRSCGSWRAGARAVRPAPSPEPQTQRCPEAAGRPATRPARCAEHGRAAYLGCLGRPGPPSSSPQAAAQHAAAHAAQSAQLAHAQASDRHSHSSASLTRGPPIWAAGASPELINWSTKTGPAVSRSCMICR